MTTRELRDQMGDWSNGRWWTARKDTTPIYDMVDAVEAAIKEWGIREATVQVIDTGVLHLNVITGYDCSWEEKALLEIILPKCQQFLADRCRDEYQFVPISQASPWDRQGGSRANYIHSIELVNGSRPVARVVFNA
jgi:hypothetical protein